jgi:hypothetical protein
MNCKSILIIISIILFIIFSCKKKIQTETTDIYGEEVYTDSFNPVLWENPAYANKIEVTDMDIGKIIKDDVIDPRFRKILLIVKNFADYILTNNNLDIQLILTPSAFNSFNLRYETLATIPDQKYSLRVAYPVQLQFDIDNSISSDNNMRLNKNRINEADNPPVMETTEEKPFDAEPFWISFKILIPDKKSIISKVELTLVKEDYIISDFEDDFYTKLIDIIGKK